MYGVSSKAGEAMRWKMEDGSGMEDGRRLMKDGGEMVVDGR